MDRAEKKEYERCVFPTLCNGVTSGAVIQLDMSTSSGAPHMPRLVHRRGGFVRSGLVVLPCRPTDMQSSLGGRACPMPCGRPRTAEDIYAAYGLQSERIMRVSRNGRARSIGDQHGR